MLQCVERRFGAFAAHFSTHSPPLQLPQIAHKLPPSYITTTASALPKNHQCSHVLQTVPAPPILPPPRLPASTLGVRPAGCPGLHRVHQVPGHSPAGPCGSALGGQGAPQGEAWCPLGAQHLATARLLCRQVHPWTPLLATCAGAATIFVPAPCPMIPNAPCPLLVQPAAPSLLPVPPPLNAPA